MESIDWNRLGKAVAVAAGVAYLAACIEPTIGGKGSVRLAREFNGMHVIFGAAASCCYLIATAEGQA